MVEPSLNSNNTLDFCAKVKSRKGHDFFTVQKL